MAAAIRAGAGRVADIAIARVLHVLAIVRWIGGVGMVTTILLPAIRRFCPADQRFRVFPTMEVRFAWQARLATLIAAARGFSMAWRLDAWDRFQFVGYWWMHAMALTWLVFIALLSCFLQRLLAACGPRASEQRS